MGQEYFLCGGSYLVQSFKFLMCVCLPIPWDFINAFESEVSVLVGFHDGHETEALLLPNVLR